MLSKIFLSSIFNQNNVAFCFGFDNVLVCQYDLSDCHLQLGLCFPNEWSWCNNSCFIKRGGGGGGGGGKILLGHAHHKREARSPFKLRPGSRAHFIRVLEALSRNRPRPNCHGNWSRAIHPQALPDRRHLYHSREWVITMQCKFVLSHWAWGWITQL